MKLFARIRPLLPDDREQCHDGKTLSVHNEGDAKVIVVDRSKSQEFLFDRVFDHSATQEDGFKEVSDFVQSALEGCHVCLISYGQTGSGKTHTIQGGAKKAQGIIPHFLTQIGASKTALEKDGWVLPMNVLFLEIHNESIYDLLSGDRNPKKKPQIQNDEVSCSRVSNVKVIPINPNDVVTYNKIWADGAKHRSTVSTAMNATSINLNYVFTIKMAMKHTERNEVLRGTLTLVNLAGTE